MRWTVSEHDVECGLCSDLIPPNQPIALLTSKNKVRCKGCAEQAGYVVNQEEVDNERFRLEADRAASEAARLRRFELEPRRGHSRSMSSLAAASAGFFDQFDPKAKAAGED